MVTKGADAAKLGGKAIDRALRAVQDVVMKDFKIGKQKPVDMLVQYRRTGWGNLWLLCDGLTDEEREGVLKPTYLVVDDPTYWIRLAGPSQ